nr:MAG TPA: Baseplate wedge protein [Caudoviricetes sp.]
MATKFYALLTTRGQAKLAQAAALGTQLKITQMAVGDGNGALPTPNASQTALVHENRRAALNSLTVDPLNVSQIIAEQVIPENEGGWWIREIGLFDEVGDLIAVANCAETYKPLLAEGSGRTQVIRMILIVSSTEAVTLKIDPAVVLATRKYVDDAVIEVKAYADDLMAKHLAAADPHTQYAPKVSPTLTGTPKAPTAANGNNTTQIATTQFVQAALELLKGGAPLTLDTLAELAAAINNDPNFYQTMASALALKAAIASPTFTGTPKAPTAAAGNNTTQLATTAFVQTAIAQLVASAPGALDTLNELAAALGDDPNFAATITNQLALKAPLASPALTGTPTAPTPAVSKNDTQIATTAFVQAAFKSLLSSETDSNSDNQAATPKALKAVKDGSLQVRGQIPATPDVNRYGPTADFLGRWYLSAGSQYSSGINLPENQPGTLVVEASGRFNCQQTFETSLGNVWIRSLSAAWNGIDGPWMEWSCVGMGTVSGISTTDVDTLFGPGKYSCSSAAPNLPIAQPGVLEVGRYNNSSGTVYQTYKAMSANANYKNRMFTRSFVSNSWTDWVEQVGAPASATPATGTNISGPMMFTALETGSQESTHQPVAGELFGGMHVVRGLRPAQFGVSGRGNAASFWFRGYDNASSVQAEWKKAITTNDEASLLQKGIVKLSSATDSGDESIAATSKAVKAVMDETVKLNAFANNVAPVGVIMTWPTATPPTGWIKCNGASFSAATYPELAKVYPTLKVPDLRGEFIRGFDDGRGVDSGRGIGTNQAAYAGSFTVKGGNIAMQANTSGTPMLDSITFNETVVINDNTNVNTIPVNAGDSRPRNVAYNFIVRAA